MDKKIYDPTTWCLQDRPEVERYEEIKSKSWEKGYKEKPQTTSRRAPWLSDHRGCQSQRGTLHLMKGSQVQADVTTIHTQLTIEPQNTWRKRRQNWKYTRRLQKPTAGNKQNNQETRKSETDATPQPGSIWCTEHALFRHAANTLWDRKIPEPYL